jgi:hypothetical protein
LDDLRKAKESIEMAIKLFPMEKIHKQKPKILLMLNLDNCMEAYKDEANHVMKRLEERRQWELFTLKRNIFAGNIIIINSDFLEVEVDVAGGSVSETRVWRRN